jgi:hypothetical protein
MTNIPLVTPANPPPLVMLVELLIETPVIVTAPATATVQVVKVLPEMPPGVTVTLGVRLVAADDHGEDQDVVVGNPDVDSTLTVAEP